MNPINFPQANHIFGPPPGMSEEECGNLPVAHATTPSQQEVFISCWEMSDEELQTITKTRKIWVWQFGNIVQPIALATTPPFEEEKPNDRTANLHPDYEFRTYLEHGIGMFSVNKHTGKPCDCKMEWNEDGTILSCPVCGLDGT